LREFKAKSPHCKKTLTAKSAKESQSSQRKP
jgi:hypothetical protein